MRKNVISDRRFEKVYNQGVVDVIEIWVDKETGVNYIYRMSGYAGGLSPLLDKNGKPIITEIKTDKEID